MKKEAPYTSIARYLSGESTKAEENEISRWRNTSPENEALFSDLRRQWEYTSASETFVIPDKNKVWETIRQEITYKHQFGNRPFYNKTQLIKTAGIAALIALLIGCFVTLFFQPLLTTFRNGLPITTIAPAGQKSQLLLPDSTLVWLNSGTRLTYTTHYNTHDRIVRLEGEAFFKVKKNTNLPFIVETGEINIQVHGTQFNIDAYPAENNITVALLQGKVTLHTPYSNKTLTSLKPGQLATISRTDHTCRVQPCDAEMESLWHLNKLKFENTPVQEVWKKLSRWYGVDIKIQNEKDGQTYWFTVKTETLTELLERIDKLTPITYKINGEEVTIDYK